MFGRKGEIAALIVLQFALGSVYLSRIPRIFVDEVWYSALGYNLAHRRELRHPFIEGFGGIHVRFVQNQIVLPSVCAAVFKVADYSIAASRIGSVLFGAVAIVSLYCLTRRWFGEKQAFLVGLVTLIHPWFFEVSRRTRPEIYYTALGLLFLWLVTLFFDSRSRVLAFFAGVIAGLAALTHPNGLILVFSIGCAVILWLRPKPIARLAAWAAAGFAVVLLPYVIYVSWAIRNPQVSFVEQMQTSMVHSFLLKGEIIRWKSFLQWPKGLPLAVIMALSWIGAWYRSSAAEKTLATIIGLFVLILPLATVNRTPRYLAAITPFFSALIIRLAWRIMTGELNFWRRRPKLRAGLAAGMAAVYLATCIAAVSLMLCCLRKADFNRVIDRVAAKVGPGSRVYGDPIFWVGHDKYRYGPYLITYEGIPLTEAIEKLRKHRFDYAIRTAWLISPPKGIGKPPRSMPDFRKGCLGDHLCRIFGTKTDEFYDPYYGPIEIYRLDWDRPLWLKM